MLLTLTPSLSSVVLEALIRQAMIENHSFIKSVEKVAFDVRQSGPSKYMMVTLEITTKSGETGRTTLGGKEVVDIILAAQTNPSNVFLLEFTAGGTPRTWDQLTCTITIDPKQESSKRPEVFFI